jgi:hypothetical protein
MVFAMGQPSLSNRQALASVTGRRVSGGCALRISETRAGRRKAALVLSSVLSFLALAGAFLPLRAQTMASPSQREGSASLRAVNMARMTAERLNGGLQVYRAAMLDSILKRWISLSLLWWRTGLAATRQESHVRNGNSRVAGRTFYSECDL